MQADLIGLTPDQITPARGWLFGEADTGEYVTDSGLVVVRTLKKNPKIECFKVLKTGGAFDVCSHCRRVTALATIECRTHRKKTVPGEYSAGVGHTAWPRRAAYKKIFFGQKLYIFARNDDVVASQDTQGRLAAPGNSVIVEPVHDGLAEGSKIIWLAERDTEYIGNFHGVVVAVGPRYPWGLKAGDRVRFRRHEGTPVESDGKKYLSLQIRWLEAVYAFLSPPPARRTLATQ